MRGISFTDADLDFTLQFQGFQLRGSLQTSITVHARSTTFMRDMMEHFADACANYIGIGDESHWMLKINDEVVYMYQRTGYDRYGKPQSFQEIPEKLQDRDLESVCLNPQCG